MNSDLQRAKNLLESSNYTCVLCKADALRTSTHRGVKPLMALLGEDMSGFSAADKVVGKATALLYCLLGVRAVYAAVISKPALAVLDHHGIAVIFKTLVPSIVNRQGTGSCPMELATAHIEDPADAPAAIEAALNELAKGDSPI